MIRTVQEVISFLGNEYTVSYRSHIAVNVRVNRININLPISKKELMEKIGGTNEKTN